MSISAFASPFDSVYSAYRKLLFASPASSKKSERPMEWLTYRVTSWKRCQKPGASNDCVKLRLGNRNWEPEIALANRSGGRLRESRMLVPEEFGLAPTNSRPAMGTWLLAPAPSVRAAFR